MTRFRTFLLRQRAMVALLLMATLCLRVLVPAGYMIGLDSRAPTLQLCRADSRSAGATQLVIPIKGDPGNPTEHQAEGECPFMVLSAASLAGPDPDLLTIALACILTLGFALIRSAPRGCFFYLQPPLRGPPAHI